MSVCWGGEGGPMSSVRYFGVYCEVQSTMVNSNTPILVNRQLWKHYFSSTSLVDDSNKKITERQQIDKELFENNFSCSNNCVKVGSLRSPQLSSCIFLHILKKKKKKPAISCVNDQNATTAPERHMWAQFTDQILWIHWIQWKVLDHFGKAPASYNCMLSSSSTNMLNFNLC